MKLRAHRSDRRCAGQPLFSICDRLFQPSAIVCGSLALIENAVSNFGLSKVVKKTTTFSKKKRNIGRFFFVCFVL